MIGHLNRTWSIIIYKECIRSVREEFSYIYIYIYIRTYDGLIFFFLKNIFFNNLIIIVREWEVKSWMASYGNVKRCQLNYNALKI